MLDTQVENALAENAYIEVQEWLLSMNDDVIDADVLEYSNKLHIDIPKGAMYFVRTFGGNNSFIDSLKGQLVRKGTLSIPQMRAALNVLKREMTKGTIQIARKDGRVAPIPMVERPVEYRPHADKVEEGQDQPDELHRTRCYTCNKYFSNFNAVKAHKAVAHFKGGAPVAVLKDNEVEDTKLDLSKLPDGRYAINDPSKANDFLFFAVKTIKRRAYRDRKYRYGKFRVGHEWIEVGTIEVRLWSQDAKKLVGAQNPGRGYRGEYVDQLVKIMEHHEAWALVFASMIGRCSICGKTLTDDNSRDLAIGPECFKKWGHEYFKKYDRSAVVAAALAGKVDDDEDDDK